jgi:hypothetical protein
VNHDLTSAAVSPALHGAVSSQSQNLPQGGKRNRHVDVQGCMKTAAGEESAAPRLTAIRAAANSNCRSGRLCAPVRCPVRPLRFPWLHAVLRLPP